MLWQPPPRETQIKFPVDPTSRLPGHRSPGTQTIVPRTPPVTLFCPQKSLRTRCVSICLLLAFVATICRPARASFPLHCIRPVSRVEGPIVPAPKNWGYRPTRWIRWEGTVVHPPLGPVPADVEKKPAAKDAETDAETIATPPPVAETATPPETDHEPLEIPPLPLDDGPPQIPDNFDDDLPPLPGQPTPPRQTPKDAARSAPNSKSRLRTTRSQTERTAAEIGSGREPPPVPRPRWDLREKNACQSATGAQKAATGAVCPDSLRPAACRCRRLEKTLPEETPRGKTDPEKNRQTTGQEETTLVQPRLDL